MKRILICLLLLACFGAAVAASCDSGRYRLELDGIPVLNVTCDANLLHHCWSEAAAFEGYVFTSAEIAIHGVTRRFIQQYEAKGYRVVPIKQRGK